MSRHVDVRRHPPPNHVTLKAILHELIPRIIGDCHHLVECIEHSRPESTIMHLTIPSGFVAASQSVFNAKSSPTAAVVKMISWNSSNTLIFIQSPAAISLNITSDTVNTYLGSSSRCLSIEKFLEIIGMWVGC